MESYLSTSGLLRKGLPGVSALPAGKTINSSR
jgi:hypothetical protein